jgi:phosphate transport system permease protein
LTTVTPQAGPAIPAGPAHPLAQRRPLGDRTFQIIALVSGLLVLVILILIAVSTTQQASSWFTTEGWWIFGKTWNPAANQFGALAFIYGTAITAAIALVIAVPVSVEVALLLTEVVPYRVSRPIVYVVALLAVVPSVVWGLWGSRCTPGSSPHLFRLGVNGVPVRPVRAPTSGSSFSPWVSSWPS